MKFKCNSPSSPVSPPGAAHSATGSADTASIAWVPLYLSIFFTLSDTLSSLSTNIYGTVYKQYTTEVFPNSARRYLQRYCIRFRHKNTQQHAVVCEGEERGMDGLIERGFGLVVLERERENRRERREVFDLFYTHLFIYFTLNVCEYDFCALFVRFFSSFYFFNLPFWWASLFYGRFFIFYFLFCFLFNFFLKKQIKKKIVSSFLTLYYALGSPNSNPMPDAAGNFIPC